MMAWWNSIDDPERAAWKNIAEMHEPVPPQMVRDIGEAEANDTMSWLVLDTENAPKGADYTTTVSEQSTWRLNSQVETFILKQ